MERRQLGKTGINVTPVIFGAWAIGEWMWGPQDDDDAIRAIHTALDEGINAIDTAAIYGFGHSETLVGKVLADRRDEVVVMTKFGLRWDIDGEAKGADKRWETQDLDGNPQTVWRYAGAESVVEECERSLRRLGTDRIDVYQIHWPDPATPIDETFEAVEKLIQQGKIRAAGVSNYSPEQMEAANGIVPLASSQPPFSMVLREAEQDVIPWCREHDVGVVVYSPLQRGLLTGKFEPDHVFHTDDHRKNNPMFSSENIRRVNEFLYETVSPIAEVHDATVPQTVIAWTFERPGITGALVGARNEDQARENAGAMRIELSDEQQQQIDKGLDELCLETSA
ncbi:MAG: aldo/keto reductase [Bacteroidetes bacterium]|jgi:aryl-alcohol dehydrogenase-like predicted oxidoreductase|nr:aldo/keto reductase [Bacteroidota bacterium]